MCIHSLTLIQAVVHLIFPCSVIQNVNHGWFTPIPLEPQTRPALLCLLRDSRANYLLYVFYRRSTSYFVQPGHSPQCKSLTVLSVIDAAPLLPSSLRPNVSYQLREFYFNTYNDKFFEAPAPVWFTVFITMEVFYHAPLSIWAIGALLRGGWPRPVMIMQELNLDTDVVCLVKMTLWSPFICWLLACSRSLLRCLVWLKCGPGRIGLWLRSRTSPCCIFLTFCLVSIVFPSFFNVSPSRD